MAKSQEKRSSVRVPVDLEIEIRTESKTFQGTVLNCSSGGLFVRSAAKLDCGDLLDIKIQLPGALRPIRAKSRVIWTDFHRKEETPGFGVHFVSLSETDEELLRNFLYPA